MKKSILLTALIAVLLLFFGKSYSQQRVSSQREAADITANSEDYRSSLKYATWDRSVSWNSGSRYIASGQGTWVKATGTSPVLQATETEWAEEPAITNLIRITMLKGTLKDEAIIHFRSDATSGYDSNADALKLSGSMINVSTLDDSNDNLAINSMGEFHCSANVRVNIDKPATGTYSFAFTEYQSFDPLVAITLTDAFTNTSFNVRNGGNYTFTVSAVATSYGSDRFKMKFEVINPIPDFTATAPSALCTSVGTMIEMTNTQSDVVYELRMDNVFVAQTSGNGGSSQFDIPSEMLTQADNEFKIIATKMCATAVTKELTISVVPTFEVASVTPAKHCQSGAVTLSATGAPEDGSYNWYESETGDEPIVDQHAADFATPVLSASQTYYVAVANRLGCEGERAPVAAEIIQYENITIAEDGDSLRTNYTSNQQWYFNSEIINGATGPALKPTQSGTYKVEAIIEGCSTTAEKGFEIILAVEQQSAFELKLYPNPVTGQLQIEIPDSDKNIKGVQILDSTGRPIGSFQLRHEGGKRIGQFEIGNYPPGLYIVHAEGNVKNINAKVVKR